MLLPLLISAIVAQAPAGPATSARGPIIVIQTEAGNIRVRLDPIHAPGTVANFLRYVDDSFFDHAFFYRTVTTHPDNQPNKQVKIDVIQGGVNDAKDTYAPVPLERTSVTGLKHLDGTISMARDGPDTATSEFFICVGDQPELDFGGHRNPDGQGFAAFGQVIDGMDIVRRIHGAPAEGQVLNPPIAIIRIVREAPAR